jgi:predicted metal-binding protein
VQRKLGDLTRTIQKREGVEKNEIVVHLASCITHHNFHGPPCPHLDYLKTMIAEKAGLEIVEGTHISKLAERRRAQGVYPV